MQTLVGDHGHKLQTLFQKEQYFVDTYQQKISRLPSTVSALNSSNCFGDGCPHGARRITHSASTDTDICTCCFALSVTTAGQTVNHFLPSFPPWRWSGDPTQERETWCPCLLEPPSTTTTTTPSHPTTTSLWLASSSLGPWSLSWSLPSSSLSPWRGAPSGGKPPHR